MKLTISPKLRQIETGVRLRQICSVNLRRLTVIIKKTASIKGLNLNLNLKKCIFKIFNLRY